MKLTKPQRSLLEEIGGRSSRLHCDPAYKPIVKLLELGLVDRREHSMSAPSFGLTEAGWNALATPAGGEEGR